MLNIFELFTNPDFFFFNLSLQSIPENSSGNPTVQKQYGPLLR